MESVMNRWSSIEFLRENNGNNKKVNKIAICFLDVILDNIERQTLNAPATKIKMETDLSSWESIGMRKPLSITQGSLESISKAEHDFLKFCCYLPHVDYVTAIDKGSNENAEFWLFLKEYNYHISKTIMAKCLDYFDQYKVDYEIILVTEDQVNKELMPSIKVEARKNN